MKRFKNRLKLFDSALEHMHTTKLEKSEFEYVKETLNKNTATSIFNDMQKIFDSTVLHLTCKMDQEIKKLKHQYETKLNEQKIIVTAFEKKFSYFITGRIERLE